MNGVLDDHVLNTAAMQMPVSQAPSGLFCPSQQAYGSSNSQAMQQFPPAGQPTCGVYPSGLQVLQPQQQCGLVRQQQQQALSAGTGSAGARNPFAAMPRELRNSQLRSNLAAVAGAFSACSGSAASGRGASPPASAPRSNMVPPPPPPQHQHQQWSAPAMQGAAAAAIGLASHPGMYLAASSGMELAPSQLPVSMGMAGSSFSTAPGLQQAYGGAGTSNGSATGPYSTCMPGTAYTAPLPQPLQSTYLQQQQQRMMMSQHADMHAGFYSDPLPYLAGVNMAAPAMPASQQQQHQAQQLLFCSQGMPCSLQPMQSASMPYPAAAGAESLSHAQLLLQKQQALQQLQAVEEMMLMRLLPDA